MAAGDRIVQGVGKVYWATVDAAQGIRPLSTTQFVTSITNQMPRTATPVGVGWQDLGDLSEEGMVMAPDQQIQFVGRAGSLHAIDARQVAAGGSFALNILEATMQNIYIFGMGRVGVKAFMMTSDTADDASSDPEEVEITDDNFEFLNDPAGTQIGATGRYVQGDPGNRIVRLTFPRTGGPEDSLEGISLLIDGFGGNVEASGKRWRRRIWVPRAINGVATVLPMTDRTQQLVSCQFTSVLADADTTTGAKNDAGGDLTDDDIPAFDMWEGVQS